MKLRSASLKTWLTRGFAAAMVLQLCVGAAGAAPVAGPKSAVDETKVPHYFGPYPNYANSPYTLGNAVVSISGDGSGAEATATVGLNGAVTGITVTKPGSGYTSANVSISGSGTGALATAVITSTGSVSSVTVGAGGAGYVAPAVSFIGTSTTPAAGTAYGGVDKNIVLVSPGSGYHKPTVNFDLPDDPNGRVAVAHVTCVEPNCSNPNPDGTPGVVTITGIALDDSGSGYSSAPAITILDGTQFNPIKPGGTGASATATLTIQSVSLTTFGSGYTTPPTVSITDTKGSGAGALATATLANGVISAINVTSPGSGYITKGIQKFVDTLPVLCDPTGVAAPSCPTDPAVKALPIGVPDPNWQDASGKTFPDADTYEIGLVQYAMKFYSSQAQPTLVRGYVQLSTPSVPGQHVALQNTIRDATGAFVQVPTGFYGVTPPQYLGPTLLATKDKPVRIIFRNLLPKGSDGDLFLPVDSTMMGSGMGPQANQTPPADLGTVLDGVRNPMCTSGYMDMMPGPETGCYVQNRATLHLHGGITPWISDGTPHQWITPAGEDTAYPQGVSVQNVPDMNVCGTDTDGCQTFYYTNQQSARLMFYHDHAWGITRLNVYAGEAAGYLISDNTEKNLVSSGAIPADQIPLIIQDKTFVPGKAQLAQQDPTWDTAKWGGEGSLWTPHVYMPAQNPGDPSGMSGFGRWMYGPWFWPPATDVPYQPIANPYYNMDPEGPDGIRGNADDFTSPLGVACNLDDPTTWQYQTEPFCEPKMIPGTPNITVGMEAFNDTPVVNGTAYPTVTLDPKSYRLRILNAANDRFWNLQWYVGDPTTQSTGTNANGQSIGATEVALNPAELAAAQTDPVVFPTTLKSIVDPATGQTVDLNGPDWIQIGSEGGFLPAPAVIDGQQVTTWITDPTRFDVGNVDQHSLLLAPAERADVVVDFSKFAGKTLILYNDAPAAFPARVPSYDYYTGGPDLSPVGAPAILPGYGPNTRTVMQVKIAANPPAAAFDLAKLQNAFRHHSDGSGAFESGQHPIIVGQAAYNSAYGTNFAASSWCNAPGSTLDQCDGYARIQEQGVPDFKFGFNALSDPNKKITLPFQPKGIHDEMNSTSFDEYGRMQATIGLEAPGATPLLQNIILYPYVNPSSEIIDATNLPVGDVNIQAVAPAPGTTEVKDGTQIWKITHNGVDTHPLHFHMFDVQVLNRVTWDNIIIPPDPNELGWKDTLRVSPLEDTIVALRPIVPSLPWELPNSIRPLNPSMPIGSTLMFNSTDAAGNPTAPITNQLTNFGWEYVWHCHILSHEEMDMMRPVSVAIPPKAPTTLTQSIVGTGNKRAVVLNWTDNSISETGYVVQRALSQSGPWTDLATLPKNTTTFTDPVGNTKVTTYVYQVLAANDVGYTGVPGYSTLRASKASNMVTVQLSGTTATLPAAPTNLTATAQGPQILLTWTDNATNESGFILQRAVNGGTFADLIQLPLNNNTGTVKYTDTAVVTGNTYAYQVAAINAAGRSTYSNTATATVGSVPAAPTGVTATAVVQNQKSAQATLTWTDVATDETGYNIQFATDAAFTANLVKATVGANVTTFTTGNIPRNRSFYFRVQAFNGNGPSAWVNATPFPITTP